MSPLSKKILTILYLLLGVVVCFMAHTPIDKKLVQKEIAAEFQQTFHVQEQRLEQQFQNLINHNLSNIPFDIDYYSVKNGKLETWSKQLFTAGKAPIDGKVLEALNGHYYSRVKRIDSVEYGLFHLLKTNISIQNEYIPNDFNPVYHLSKESILSIEKHDGYVPIYNLHNEVSFYLKIKNVDDLADLYWLYGVLIWATMGIFLGIKLDIQQWGKWQIVVLFIGLMVVRGFMIHFQFPKQLYEGEIFSPILYAQYAWAPSLGDMGINVLLALLTIRKILQYVSPHKRIFHPSIVVFLHSVWVVVFYGINSILVGLIINSTIKLNLPEWINFDLYTLCVGTILALLFYAWYSVWASLMALVYPSWKYKLAIACVPIIIGGIAIITQQGACGMVHVYTAVALTILYGLFLFFPLYNKVVSTGIFTFLITIPTTYIFYSTNTVKEHEKRQLLAEQISTQKDALLETRYTTTLGSIMHSIDTLNLQKTENHTEIHKAFNNTFKGFWQQYQINWYIFDTKENLITKSADNNIADYSYFKNELYTYQPVINNELYHTNNPPDPTNNYIYLGKNYIVQDRDTNYILFIEFKPKSSHITSMYPEILHADNTNEEQHLSNYSTAIYTDNNLITSTGTYAYPVYNTLFASIFHPIYQEETEYSHLVYKNAYNKTILISKLKEDMLTVIISTLQLYLFIYLSFLVLQSWYEEDFWQGLFGSKSFKNKIILFTISLLGFAFIGSGIITIYLTTQQYDKKFQKELYDKITAATSQFEQQIHNVLLNGTPPADKYAEIIKDIANVSNVNLVLYDTNGTLLVCSEPELVEKGIIGPHMNFMGLQSIKKNYSSFYIQKEQIQAIEYWSAYTPIRDKCDEWIGYLNIPYFNKQKELRKDLSESSISLINLFLLVAIAGIATAIFISNQLTKPLTTIKEHLAHVAFTKKNIPIHALQNDEIGSLIQQYNSTVAELEKSTALLAQSEREMAWREMAKQVAHEIKNPLTPMKLNIQYLSRIVANSELAVRQKIDKITIILIEQIDALTTIANAFASFAKMPTMHKETIYLHGILSNVIDLYSQEYDTITLHADITILQNVAFWGDKEHWVRIFNNIVKNACQAIPSNQEGYISITTRLADAGYEIAIQDNGIGIADDKKEKMFVPYFTTKSSGTGLGLAIVKNSIEAHNGSIRYVSELGVGTTFYITLPSIGHNGELGV